MPDRGKAVAHVDLTQIGHRHPAELGQDVQRQGRPPSPGLAVALQLGLAGLEGRGGDGRNRAVGPRGVAGGPAAPADGVDAAARQPAPAGGGCPGSGQPDLGGGPEPHLAAPAVNGDAQDPERAPLAAPSGMKSAAVAVPAGRGDGGEDGREPVN